MAAHGLYCVFSSCCWRKRQLRCRWEIIDYLEYFSPRCAAPIPCDSDTPTRTRASVVDTMVDAGLTRHLLVLDASSWSNLQLHIRWHLQPHNCSVRNCNGQLPRVAVGGRQARPSVTWRCWTASRKTATNGRWPVSCREVTDVASLGDWVCGSFILLL